MSRRIAMWVLGVVLLAGPASSMAQGGEGQARPHDTLRRAGGIQLLLEARREPFARARLADMEAAIRREMRANGIAVGEVSTSGGQLGFVVRDPARLDEAVRSARAQGAAGDVAGQPGWDVRILAGNRIAMRPTRAGLDRAVSRAMDAAREVIGRRIGALGVRDPNIVRRGPDRILVQVRGVRDPGQLKSLIARTARLEFKLVDANVPPQRLRSGRPPPGTQILPYPEGGPGAHLAVGRRAILTGEMIADARLAFDDLDGRAAVTIRFDSDGSRRFARVTQSNVDRQFAIILDDVIISAPTIREPILGGTAQISGAFTVESATALAISLRSGALPIDLSVIEERALPD